MHTGITGGGTMTSTPFDPFEGGSLTRYTHECPDKHFISYEEGKCKICRKELVEMETPKEPTLAFEEKINNPFEDSAPTE